MRLTDLKATTLIATLLCLQAQAADLPPACAQLEKAWRACVTNYVNYTEVADPKSYAQYKDMPLDVITQNLKVEGISDPSAQAQHCAAPDFKQHLIGTLANVVSQMKMVRSLQPDCLNAYRALR